MQRGGKSSPLIIDYVKSNVTLFFPMAAIFSLLDEKSFSLFFIVKIPPAFLESDANFNNDSKKYVSAFTVTLHPRAHNFSISVLNGIDIILSLFFIYMVS